MLSKPARRQFGVVRDAGVEDRAVLVVALREVACRRLRIRR